MSATTNGHAVRIEVTQSPRHAFDCITTVTKWWVAPAGDFEGRSTELDDEFVIRHGDVHYSKQRLIERVPDRKLVWLVTESKLTWLEKNQSEWTHTRLVFELTSGGDKTAIHFTHEGLLPEMECFARVSEAWNRSIKERLCGFITHGIPRPPPSGNV
jgi:Activator of Hsp90 ATPase homolog 1-like protein